MFIKIDPPEKLWERVPGEKKQGDWETRLAFDSLQTSTIRSLRTPTPERDEGRMRFSAEMFTSLPFPTQGPQNTAGLQMLEACHLLIRFLS